MKSHQTTFNIVVRHLRQQGVQAAKPTPNALVSKECRYRFRKGKTMLMCAAGCLIDDADYKRKMESNSCYVDPNSRPDSSPEGCKLVHAALVKQGHDPKFVREMQMLHDNYDPVDWEDQFKKIARENKLKVPKAKKS